MISSTNTSPAVARSSVPLIEEKTLTASRENPAGPETLTVSPRDRRGANRLSTCCTDDLSSVSSPPGLRFTISSAVVWSGETLTITVREPVTGGDAAKEARTRAIAARSSALRPVFLRTTVTAVKRSPEGKRLARVSSLTDSDEPGRNEDSSFFWMFWKRWANEPPRPPKMSHTRTIPIRAARDANKRSRNLTLRPARDLLQRLAGAPARSRLARRRTGPCPTDR